MSQRIYVDMDGSEYPACPLRSDLSTCKVLPKSEINSCRPNLDGDGKWHVTEDCPLRDPYVVVEAWGFAVSASVKKVIQLYPHLTDGGAEYLTDAFVECPSGEKEGIFKGARFIVRLDGDSAQLTIVNNGE